MFEIVCIQFVSCKLVAPSLTLRAGLKNECSCTFAVPYASVLHRGKNLVFIDMFRHWVFGYNHWRR
jgi:hypothetical protein